MAPTTLKLAVCLFTDVANTDYGGVIEFLAFLRPKALAMGFFKSDYLIDVTYFHYDHTPFRGSDIGPLMIPDRTYDDLKDGEQFDIVLVPGGMVHFLLQCDKQLLTLIPLYYFPFFRKWRFTRGYPAFYSQIPPTPGPWC